MLPKEATTNFSVLLNNKHKVVVQDEQDMADGPGLATDMVPDTQPIVVASQII